MTYDNRITHCVLYVKDHGYVMNKPKGCNEYNFTQSLQHARVYPSLGAAKCSADYVLVSIGHKSYESNLYCVIPVFLQEFK